MAKWRSIVVDGITYNWTTGRSGEVYFRGENISSRKINRSLMPNLPDDVERAKWKRYYRVKPSDVATGIREMVKDIDVGKQKFRAMKPRSWPTKPRKRKQNQDIIRELTFITSKEDRNKELDKIVKPQLGIIGIIDHSIQTRLADNATRVTKQDIIEHQNVLPNELPCPICDSKGKIEDSLGELKKCPLCQGKKSVKIKNLSDIEITVRSRMPRSLLESVVRFLASVLDTNGNTIINHDFLVSKLEIADTQPEILTLHNSQILLKIER